MRLRHKAFRDQTPGCVIKVVPVLIEVIRIIAIISTIFSEAWSLRGLPSEERSKYLGLKLILVIWNLARKNL
jgi:hypothetical protein